MSNSEDERAILNIHMENEEENRFRKDKEDNASLKSARSDKLGSYKSSHGDEAQSRVESTRGARKSERARDASQGSKQENRLDKEIIPDNLSTHSFREKLTDGELRRALRIPGEFNRRRNILKENLQIPEAKAEWYRIRRIMEEIMDEEDRLSFQAKQIEVTNEDMEKIIRVENWSRKHADRNILAPPAPGEAKSLKTNQSSEKGSSSGGSRRSGDSKCSNTSHQSSIRLKFEEGQLSSLRITGGAEITPGIIELIQATKAKKSQKAEGRKEAPEAVETRRNRGAQKARGGEDEERKIFESTRIECASEEKQSSYEEINQDFTNANNAKKVQTMSTTLNSQIHEIIMRPPAYKLLKDKGIKFCGTEKDNPIIFLEELQELRESYNLSDEDIFNNLPMLLDQEAKTWYTINRRNARNLEDFIAIFKENYASERQQEEIRREINRTRQKDGEKLRDFINRFRVLMTRCVPAVAEKKQLVECYKRTKPTYQRYIKKSDLRNWKHLKDKGEELEEIGIRQSEWYQSEKKPEVKRNENVKERFPRQEQRWRTNDNKRQTIQKKQDPRHGAKSQKW